MASIAADMRKEDREEVWASDHHTPAEALKWSWAGSDYTSVAVLDTGAPILVVGLNKRDVLVGSGVVWMLGTNLALKHRKVFMEQAKPIIGEMLEICPRLFNKVHGKNKASIRWLKRLGFTIQDPIPHGPDDELFHPFYLERSR
jgi:hypothetical protein